MNADIAEELLRRNVDKGRDFHIAAGSVLARDDAVEAARRLNLFCEYSAPNDYYTFSTRPFEPRDHHRILR